MIFLLGISVIVKFVPVKQEQKRFNRVNLDRCDGSVREDRFDRRVALVALTYN
jgi:hypothetical protein